LFPAGGRRGRPGEPKAGGRKGRPYGTETAAARAAPADPGQQTTPVTEHRTTCFRYRYTARSFASASSIAVRGALPLATSANMVGTMNLAYMLVAVLVIGPGDPINLT
jgi:hypothetical protein